MVDGIIFTPEIQTKDKRDKRDYRWNIFLRIYKNNFLNQLYQVSYQCMHMF